MHLNLAWPCSHQVAFYEKACVRTVDDDAALAGLLVVSSGSRSRAAFDISKACVIWMDFALISTSKSLDFPLLSG